MKIEIFWNFFQRSSCLVKVMVKLGWCVWYLNWRAQANVYPFIDFIDFYRFYWFFIDFIDFIDFYRFYWFFNDFILFCWFFHQFCSFYTYLTGFNNVFIRQRRSKGSKPDKFLMLIFCRFFFRPAVLSLLEQKCSNTRTQGQRWSGSKVKNG